MLLLNDFVLLCTALGVANPVVLCPFLADIVYTPVSEGSLDWPVAFELLLLYLHQIENNPDVWHFANVFAKSGAIDVRRREAMIIAKARYPSSFFRTHGGNPGSDVDKSQKGGKFDLNNITLFNDKATQACAAWNLKNSHKRENIDKNGRCKFLHGVCDQWVTDVRLAYLT